MVYNKNTILAAKITGKQCIINHCLQELSEMIEEYQAISAKIVLQNTSTDSCLEFSERAKLI